MKPLLLKKSLWNAEERKEFSGLSVKVVKGHTVVSRAESNNEIKTLYKPPVKKLLRNEKSATSIFGVELRYVI